MLFPVALKANKYKINKSIRLVGENGFSYKDNYLAENIINDELRELVIRGLTGYEFEKLCKVYQYYMNKTFIYDPNRSDLDEQEEIINENKDVDKEKIRRILQAIDPVDHEFFFRENKVYKRDNRTIALIKIFRDFKCQICSHFILKKDGSKYVEAAHIQAKNRKGPETADNIILLCPNHHKEFDLGNRTTISKTKEKYVFELNGNRYIINLKI